MICGIVFIPYSDDGDWERHHDHLAYVGYEVAYPDDDFDELELQEVFHSIFCRSCTSMFTL